MLSAYLSGTNRSSMNSASIVSSQTISYWTTGPQLTGSRWYQIFRATPKSLEREASFDYVIKLANTELAGNQFAKAVARLGREAAAIDSISHPTIIPLLDAELDNAPFFLVQPWIPGDSLDRFLSAAQDVSLVRCLWIFRQVAEAIAAAHDQERAYLGLDPSHVLLGSGGRILLIGWSRSHVVGNLLSFPCDNLQLARYSAPETLDPGALSHRASDVYALGALVYRILAGKLPIHGKDASTIAWAHRQGLFVDLIRVQPACPPRLSNLVRQMVSVKPEGRPSIREVLNELISIEIEHLENPTLIRL